jgi:hypothetical protein
VRAGWARMVLGHSVWGARIARGPGVRGGARGVGGVRLSRGWLARAYIGSIGSPGLPLVLLSLCVCTHAHTHIRVSTHTTSGFLLCIC